MAAPAYLAENDASLARLVKDGAIFIRETGAAVPSGVDWVPGPGDHQIGYYSEDGFTLSPQPGDTTDIAAHNGDDVLSDSKPGFWQAVFSALEGREGVTETYFDVEVASDGSITVTSAATNKRYDVVLVGLDQKDRLILVHLPNVQVTSREDVTFNRSTALAYGITFKTFKGGASAPYHFKAWGFVAEPDEVTPPAAPEVTGASPSAAVQGDTVTITGTDFTGTSVVKFGASNATSFTVVSSTSIEAVVPAGSAGSAAIKVTTPAGESNSFAYTRGA